MVSLVFVYFIVLLIPNSRMSRAVINYSANKTLPTENGIYSYAVILNICHLGEITSPPYRIDL